MKTISSFLSFLLGILFGFQGFINGTKYSFNETKYGDVCGKTFGNEDEGREHRIDFIVEIVMGDCDQYFWTIEPAKPGEMIKLNFLNDGIIEEIVSLYLIENGKEQKVEMFNPRHYHDVHDDLFRHDRDFILGPGQGIKFWKEHPPHHHISEQFYNDFSVKFERSKINNSCICPKIFYAATTSSWQEIQMNPPAHCPKMTCIFILETEGPNHAVDITFNLSNYNSATSEIYLEKDFNIGKVLPHEPTEISKVPQKGISGSLKRFKSDSNGLILIYFGGLEREYGVTWTRTPDKWSAKFHAYKKACECPKPMIINGTSGTFAAPGFPDFYCVTKCNYTLEIPPGKEMHLHFSQTHSIPTGHTVIPDKGNCSYGHIIWMDPTTNKAVAQWNLNALPQLLVIHGSKLTLNVHQIRCFFKASYEIKDISPGCQWDPSNQYQHFNTVSGDAAAPKNSNNGSDCSPIDLVYVFQRPNEKLNQLHIYYEPRKLPHGSSLQYATDKFATKQSVYQGHDFPIKFTDKNEVFLHFHSTRSILNEGNHFFINFTWSKVCSCSEQALIATRTPQILHSPMYPDNYCKLDCEWEIKAPSGHRVVFRIHDQNLANSDSLKIHDGHARPIYWKSGIQKWDAPITSSHRLMIVSLLTANYDPTGKGFNATYYAQSWNDVFPTTSPTTERISCSSGWSVAGPIFLVLFLVIFTCILLVLYKKFLHQNAKSWVKAHWSQGKNGPITNQRQSDAISIQETQQEDKY